MEFASKGVGTAGLTTGIIGTALGTLSSGILPNILGGNQSGDAAYINRYELGLTQQIEAQKSKNALLQSHIYTDNKTDAKVLELGNRVYADLRSIGERLNTIEHRVCKNEQENAVFAATATNNISCMQQQINQLFSLTKLVVPNGSVCPGWGTVTVSPATATTTT